MILLNLVILEVCQAERYRRYSNFYNVKGFEQCGSIVVLVHGDNIKIILIILIIFA
jgi:hypothetical protein